MKSKLNVILIFIILTTGLIFSLVYINKQQLNNIDVVEVNNIAKTVEEQWDNNQLILPETKLKFKVIDLKGNIKYSNFNASYNNYDTQIINSIKDQDTIVDITNNNQLVGKVIILNDINSLEKMKRHLTLAVIIIFTLLLSLCIVYLIYLKVYIYKPFKKLEKFAGKIAEGNLDIPLKMDKGNVFGAFTESFDIMREQLKISRENEYLANRSKKELIASLSHDIKTPIASIKALCEIMELKLTNKADVDKIHTIFQKSDQIEKLINDMFHSTLEELQELKVKPELYSSAIINEHIKNNNFYEKIKIMNSCPECLIIVDKLRIQQVIDNIINNSYKYANTDIEISYELKQSHLSVSFKDFGKGVSEEELPLIFNKFYRGTNTSGVTGSGLGLFLSKYFMEHMQGDVECYNVTDGFVVKIYIKLA